MLSENLTTATHKLGTVETALAANKCMFFMLGQKLIKHTNFANPDVLSLKLILGFQIFKKKKTDCLKLPETVQKTPPSSLTCTECC